VSSLMKRLMETTKHETVVLGPVQRHLIARGEFDGSRRHDVIHPSELAKNDFCPRAIYYRLSGWEIPKSEHGFQLEVIFQQGHGYHEKWQNWLWDVGMLRGRFRCLGCMHGDWTREEIDAPWYTTAPTACPECGASREHLQYGEVPIHLPKYRIHGHSDGDIDLGGDEADNPLLEIKSIGTGTIRFEAPRLIAKHTHKLEIDGEEKSWTDWDKIWRDIKRPFKTHLRQGAIYCLAKGRSEMVYIYEYKPTGAMKEFRVKHDFSILDDLLDDVLDILYALEKGKVPDCPNGDDCPNCKPYEELRDGARDGEEEDGPEDREGSGSGAGEGEDGEEGDSTSPQAGRRRRARTSGRSTRRPLGRGSDGGTEAPHEVDELPRSRGRTRRVGRDGGGANPRSRQGRDPHARGERRSEGQRDRPEGTRRVVRRRPRS
jgi:hypothetical protein